MKSLKIILPIVGIVILIIIIFFTINIYKMQKNSENNQIENNNIEETNKVVDKMELKIENKEKDIDSTNILVEVNEELENFEIILPDETISNEQNTEYRVTENGNYTFTLVLEEGTKIETQIKVTNLREILEEEKKPSYIPEGFFHKEGTVGNGYVISDQYGNEFVWVPVESGLLTRKNSSKKQYKENDKTAKGLVNSVAKNYGFYISRYEASKADFDGIMVSGSFLDVEPWNNVNYSEAKKAAELFTEIFGYNDVKSALINSYAWDTTLKWLNQTEKSYSTSLEYGNYSEEIMTCGENETDCINNIYDMAGNLKEWTTELNDSNKNEEDENDFTSRVIRGGSCNQKKSASSQITYSEDASDEYWGFRIILYK